jgi:GT2 family glycosyltransferase
MTPSSTISSVITKISVIICVYTEDRWEHILAAVDSVRQQTLPAAETIIVVDHNPALYTRLASLRPDVTVVENREAPGLSGGRNTGSALAQGEIIAFLDDDATADPDWLRYLCADYSDPDIQGVGGLTVPNWQTGRPAWMPKEFDWVVGCNYQGMPPSGAPVRNLLGGNMSFRREVFSLVDGFRSGLGRTAEALPLGGEETEFCIQLHQRSPGAVLVMEHRAKVRHYVSDSRCRFSYFISRCYAEGISKAQVADSVGRGDGLSTEHSYATRTLPLGVAKGVTDLFRGDPAGLSRAGSIIVGLGVTAAGYFKTRLGRAPRPRAS